MAGRTSRSEDDVRDPGLGTKAGLTSSVLIAAGIIALTVIAAALRFYGLDTRSLWLDEVITTGATRLAGVRDVIAWVQADIDQMPLFYVFVWLLRRWGDGAFVVRATPAVAGVLLVPATFLLGRNIGGLRMGLVAAVLATVMPYAVWYSQEARPYALFMLTTTVQMYFGLQVARRARIYDWAGLTAATVLNLYTHYLALLTTAAVAIYLLVLALRGKAVAALVVVGLAAAFVPWRPVLKSVYSLLPGRAWLVGGAIALIVAIVLDRRYRSPRFRQVELAAASSALVAIAYLPWLPSLRAFLGAPNKGFARVDAAQGPHLGLLIENINRLGWVGVALVLMAVGLVTLVIWLRHGRSAEAGILASWIVVPLALIAYLTRWAIADLDVRYLAFLFPSSLLLIAAGIEGLASMAKHLPRPGLAAPAAALLALVLVLAQNLPSLAASYSAPKDDWRGVEQHIAAATRDGSVVLAIGNYSEWSVISLDYYIRAQHSQLHVVDGRQVTSDVVGWLNQPGVRAWAVIDHPSRAQLDLINQAADVKLDFVDATKTIYVLRADDTASSALEQGRRLLRWESALEPPLGGPSAMLDVEAGQARLGPDAAPPTMQGAEASWSLGAGSTLRGDSLVLAGSDVYASFRLPGARSGDDYVVSFDHRNPGGGTQTAYVVALDSIGHELVRFPGPAGYTSADSSDWITSYYAFQVPDSVASVLVFFNARGSGDAEFRNVHVTPVIKAA